MPSSVNSLLYCKLVISNQLNITDASLILMKLSKVKLTDISEMLTFSAKIEDTNVIIPFSFQPD